MRVLLVKPRPRLRTILGLHGLQLLEPLELGYLAAAISPEHEVRILDLRLVHRPLRRLRQVLGRWTPDLLGFTAYSHEATAVLLLAAEVRRMLPRTRIIVGGHHATVAPELFLTWSGYDGEGRNEGDGPLFDGVVRGEGCRPLAAIVARLAAGQDLLGLDNVLVPGRASEPVVCGLESLQYPDPSVLPLPRRDLWDPRAYRLVWTGEQLQNWHPLLPQVSMVRTSWGCSMKCSFCIVPWLYGRHMPRPVSSVVDEIASVPSHHLYFCDDETFLDQEFAAELAHELGRRGIDRRYFAWARATTVNRSPELFRAWQRVGLDAVFVGFEFPTDGELKRVAKGSTVAANERALDTLREIGIAVHAGFMVLPEYDEGRFQVLRDYVRRMPPSLTSYTVCTPSPGTPDYQQMEPRIWVGNPYDLYDCMHPLVPTELPLRRFGRLLAALAGEGTAKVPQRAKNQPVPPLDMMRILRAEWRYRRGIGSIYRDYPRHLWDSR